MATYVDGLYKGTARGIGGKVNVEAVIEGGQLVDLVLARLKETSGIGLDAGPIMAQNIVAAGGVEGVDGLAGCTVTSNAIISATEQALAAAEGGYNDGTFTGTARGIGGQVNVAATFEAGKLTDFKLTRLKETSGIGLDAGPLVANAILEAGTYEGVDGIAGCTVTSNAILQAAQMAFEAASGAKAYEDYLAEQEKASK